MKVSTAIHGIGFWIKTKVFILGLGLLRSCLFFRGPLDTKPQDTETPPPPKAFYYEPVGQR
jgi:hypothetical protein